MSGCRGWILRAGQARAVQRAVAVLVERGYRVVCFGEQASKYSWQKGCLFLPFPSWSRTLPACSVPNPLLFFVFLFFSLNVKYLVQSQARHWVWRWEAGRGCAAELAAVTLRVAAVWDFPPVLIPLEPADGPVLLPACPAAQEQWGKREVELLRGVLGINTA